MIFCVHLRIVVILLPTDKIHNVKPVTSLQLIIDFDKSNIFQVAENFKIGKMTNPLINTNDFIYKWLPYYYKQIIIRDVHFRWRFDWLSSSIYQIYIPSLRPLEKSLDFVANDNAAIPNVSSSEHALSSHQTHLSSFHPHLTVFEFQFLKTKSQCMMSICVSTVYRVWTSK